MTDKIKIHNPRRILGRFGGGLRSLERNQATSDFGRLKMGVYTNGQVKNVKPPTDVTNYPPMSTIFYNQYIHHSV